MVILLFSFLVILYRYLAVYECGNAYSEGRRRSPEEYESAGKPEALVEGFVYTSDYHINPPDQFEVHLHYPRVAHPMFWEGRILLVPLVVFPPFPLDPQGHPFHQ